jgi:catechol 2,3-dioxygenase-like lactoylglutathione lyase family enzyme
MPQVRNVLETALYVADLERSARFYEGLFGWERMLEQERMVALRVGDSAQVLLLFRVGGSTEGEQTPGGFIPGHDGHGQLHVAFAIDTNEVEPWKARLAERGVPIESVNRPERGGTSLYFRDPDGHCVELASPGIWPNY